MTTFTLELGQLLWLIQIPMWNTSRRQSKILVRALQPTVSAMNASPVVILLPLVKRNHLPIINCLTCQVYQLTLNLMLSTLYLCIFDMSCHLYFQRV